jgi:hypothetical protein
VSRKKITMATSLHFAAAISKVFPSEPSLHVLKVIGLKLFEVSIIIFLTLLSMAWGNISNNSLTAVASALSSMSKTGLATSRSAAEVYFALVGDTDKKASSIVACVFTFGGGDIGDAFPAGLLLIWRGDGGSDCERETIPSGGVSLLFSTGAAVRAGGDSGTSYFLACVAAEDAAPISKSGLGGTAPSPFRFKTRDVSGRKLRCPITLDGHIVNKL